MSTGNSTHKVLIQCEADGFPNQGQTCAAAIEIEFGEVQRDHVQVCTEFRLAELSYAGWREHYGIDIQGFVDGLARIHTELAGSARLVDWDGEIVLCMTVVDSRRGRIAIGGQMLFVFWTDIASEDSLLVPRLFGNAGGIRITYEGLVADQSCLPPVITGLRRFIADTGIDLCSVYEQELPATAPEVPKKRKKRK